MSKNEISLDQVIDSIQATDGDGVKLNRIIGTNNIMQVGRFLLLDEFYSDNPDDYIGGFPNHPHRGFETFTYMLTGEMEHSDNKGNKGVLTPGSAQWMTAGKGIIHSEMPKQKDGLLRGLQLWINSPAAKKMVDAGYQDINAGDIPTIKKDGASIKVLSGTLLTDDGQTTGPANSVDEDPLYFDVSLPAGKTVTLPMSGNQEGFLYILEGTIKAGPDNKTAHKGQLATMAKPNGDHLRVTASEDSRFIFAASTPIDEPVARYGPFVMNTRGEIEQAVKDYNEGKF